MAKNKTIMIADDDPGVLDALCLMLEYEGYDVLCTPNGADALNIQNNMPDLLLLDIWMSGVDGRDICKQLKKQPATKNLPIVLISASQDIERSALESGADDFLAKPFEMNELLKKVAQLA